MEKTALLTNLKTSILKKDTLSSKIILSQLITKHQFSHGNFKEFLYELIDDLKLQNKSLN